MNRTPPSCVAAIAILISALFLITPVSASITGVTGTVVLESAPYPGPSDFEIFVFDEQQDVAFVGTQGLNFGTIAAAVLVSSHYLQFNPLTPTGSVGGGTVTFDAPILGIITSTEFLTADLNPDVSGTSDTYFGLESTLGAYPAGAPGTEQFRGIGSPLDNLTIDLGSNTLVITSLDVPTPGALDGIRILTASSTAVPTEAATWTRIKRFLATP